MADRTPSPENIELGNVSPARFPSETPFGQYVNGLRQTTGDAEHTAAASTTTPYSEAQKEQLRGLQTTLFHTCRLLCLLTGLTLPIVFQIVHQRISVPHAVLLRSLDGIEASWSHFHEHNRAELVRVVQFADADHTTPRQVERYFRMLGWEDLVNRALENPAEVSPAERVAVVQLFLKGLGNVLKGAAWDTTENLYPPENIRASFLLALPSAICASVLLFFSIHPLARTLAHRRRPTHASTIKRIKGYAVRAIAIIYVVIQMLCLLYVITLMGLLFGSTSSNSTAWGTKLVFGSGNMVGKKVTRINLALVVFVVATLGGELARWELKRE